MGDRVRVHILTAIAAIVVSMSEQGQLYGLTTSSVKSNTDDSVDASMPYVTFASLMLTCQT